MRVLLADKLSESCIVLLQDAGCDVISSPQLKGEELTQAIRTHNPQALVVRSTRVTAQDIAAAASLELIVRAGAGTDNIDSEAASGAGVFVANCPGKNAVAVAELTIGLMLSLDRSIPDNVIDARSGAWNKALYGKAAGLKGRTLGVIGLGSIGLEVVRRAQALEMDILAWSRSLTERGAAAIGVRRANSPVEVAESADVVTLHVAATPDTKNLADGAFFGAMKPGAFFINTTRSTVVDESEMVKAIQEKGIRVALDVFSDEPAGKEGTFDHPLAINPSVYLTHHIGASTEQAQDAIAQEAARVIVTYLQSGDVPNCVNLAVQSPATHQLTVRHRDKVGVLASVLAELRTAGWNVQEMENVIFEGARAACAYIRFDGEPDEQTIERITAQEDILAVSVIKL